MYKIVLTKAQIFWLWALIDSADIGEYPDLHDLYHRLMKLSYDHDPNDDLDVSEDALDSLLEQLDGRKVHCPGGIEVVLSENDVEAIRDVVNEEANGRR